MGWIWSSSAKTYTDEATGQTIGAAELNALHADFVTQMQDQFRAAAKTLINDGASPDQWESTLRPIVDRTQAIGYQLSRGGANAMTEADWSQVASLIEQNYGYLNQFSQDAGTGQLSEADATARAASYANSATAAAAYGRQATYDGLDLPAQPGDGGTPCLGNCNCSWDITETEDGYEATWVLGGSKNCDGCVGRASEYAPYRQSKT